MSHALRRSIVSVTVPISQALSNIYMPYSRKLITTKDYYELKNLIEIGDILLSHTRGEVLANWLIPGFWSHGGLYVGSLGQYPETIVESTTKGVNGDEDLRGFVQGKDYVWVIRPNFASKEEKLLAARWAISKIGSPYDWLFEYTKSDPNVKTKKSNKAFYCFELIGGSYDAALSSSPFQPKEFMGMPTFTGEDFLAAKDLFEQVWCNPPTKELDGAT